MNKLHNCINRLWYTKNLMAYFLWPLSLIYVFLFKLNKTAYRLGLKKIISANIPVIVIGNITVGGTGKTPFTIALTKLLIKQGYQPGIISRGYKSILNTTPYLVSAISDPHLVGDEPVLLAKETNVPVFISPIRAKALPLLEKLNCNVLLCDDGLQHHALKKDIEIILIDGERKFGNGFCLPAGPLREPKSRIKSVEFTVMHEASGSSKYTMSLQVNEIYNLVNSHQKLTSNDYSSKKIHAIAGIAYPQRFFATLHSLGLHFIEHEFPDHHAYLESDFKFCESSDILIMTEKDAIKCKQWAKDNYWVVSVESKISEPLKQDLLKRLLILQKSVS